MEALTLIGIIIAILTSVAALYNSAVTRRHTEAETRNVDQDTSSSINTELRLELNRLYTKIAEQMLLIAAQTEEIAAAKRSAAEAVELITALKERIEAVLADNARLAQENRELRQKMKRTREGE